MAFRRLFDSRIDFMLEILNHYSRGVAESKNVSFGYFQRRFCSPGTDE